MMKTFTMKGLPLALALLAGTATMAQSRMDQAARKQAPQRFSALPVHHSAPNLSGGMNSLRGGGYCAAGATGSIDFDLDERITNVTFAGINNSSPDAAPVAPAYSDYTAQVANVNVGGSYAISIGASSSIGQSFSSDQALAWIDFNQDGDFDDAGEQVYVSAIINTTAYTGMVSIPMTASIGTTRMRVRLHDTHDGSQYINVFNDTPCGDASYGEVEDYTVNIANGGGSGPDNDECAGALPILPGAGCVGTLGSLLDATESMAAATCSGFVSDLAADVWYSFVATSEVTTVGAGGAGDEITGLDVILEAFQGSCGSLSSLGCSDTSVRAGVEGLTFATTPGSTYYYRVYYYAYTDPQTVFDFATCVVAESGGSGYCAAGADGTGLGLEERIINVNFAGIDNDSPDAAPVAPAYSDFTAVSGTVQQGMDYPIAVDAARNGSATVYEENQVLAWIDWNQDEDFDDAGEQVFVSIIGPEDVYTGTVSVPADAVLGTTRMRIRLHDTHDGSGYQNNFNDTPCGLASYGEVEDYTIEVTSGGGTTPVNDLCGSVTPVDLLVGGSVSFSGDNTGATNTGDFEPGSDLEGLDPTVWHAFTTTECSNVSVSYCGTDPAFENVWIFLANACPAGNDYVLGAADGETCPTNLIVNFVELPAGTWYLPVLMDPTSAMGPYEILVSATPCATAGPYCEAGASSILFEKISNVNFAGIDNSSSAPNGYEDFTGVTGTVVGGVDYPLTVTIAAGYDTDQVLAWIDWNQDQDFDDAGEEVFMSATGVGPHSGIVSVPLTASLGVTRMRVRLHDTYTGPDYFNAPNATPCDTSSYGQVEDYSIDMIGVVTGLSELQAGSWSVFPNPNDGDMTINYQGATGATLIEMIDVAGRTVYSEQRALTQGSATPLGLRGQVAAGTYMLRLTMHGGLMEQLRVVVR